MDTLKTKWEKLWQKPSGKATVSLYPITESLTTCKVPYIHPNLNLQAIDHVWVHSWSNGQGIDVHNHTCRSQWFLAHGIPWGIGWEDWAGMHKLSWEEKLSVVGMVSFQFGCMICGEHEVSFVSNWINKGGMMWGEQLMWSWNGGNFVEAFTVFMMQT